MNTTLIRRTVPSPLALFCKQVTDSPEMTNAAARTGMWLIGAAMRTGGFPIELSFRQVREGFTRNGVTIKGTGARTETVKASLEYLEDEQFLKSVQGAPSSGGHFSRIYSLTL